MRGGDRRLRVHRVVTTTVWTRRRRSSAFRQPSPPVAGDHAARLPVRSAPMPAATTNATPTSAAVPAPGAARPGPPAARSPAPGSSACRTPRVVSRRRASSSRLNGTTGSSTARPRPTSTSSTVSVPERRRAGDHGRDERGDRHRDREALAGPPPRRRPAGSAGCRPPSRRPRPARTRPRRGRRAPCQGSVSSTTPTAASAGHRSRPRPPRATATPSGPRNSSALAVPSGSRATAAMKNSVSPAVTTPSATQASRPDAGEGRRPRADERAGAGRRPRPGAARPHPPGRCGRTARPRRRARAGRRPWSRRPAPRPSARWRRAGAGEGRRGHPSMRRIGTVHVHVLILDIPFIDPERCRHGDPTPAPPARTVPARLDARGRRRAGRHHVDRVAADRGARPPRSGTALIEPVGRRVRLTPAGRRLAEHAVTILAAVDAARLDLDPAAQPAGTLRTAGFATAIRRSLLPGRRRPRDDAPRGAPSRSPSTSRSRPSGCWPRDAVDLALIYDYTPGPGTLDRTVEVTPLWSAPLGPGGAGRTPTPRGGERRRGRSPATATHDWIVNSRNTADEDVVRTLASMAGFAPRDRPPGRQPRPAGGPDRRRARRGPAAPRPAGRARACGCCP